MIALARASAVLVHVLQAGLVGVLVLVFATIIEPTGMRPISRATTGR